MCSIPHSDVEKSPIISECMLIYVKLQLTYYYSICSDAYFKLLFLLPFNHRPSRMKTFIFEHTARCVGMNLIRG